MRKASNYIPTLLIGYQNHTDTLKSTDCQERGHAIKIQQGQRKVYQVSVREPSLLLCMCPECTILPYISTDNSKATRKPLDMTSLKEVVDALSLKVMEIFNYFKKLSEMFLVPFFSDFKEHKTHTGVLLKYRFFFCQSV